jgi:beta-fructofuranosidase
MLASSELWIWDSWVADDGERFHLFFLEAPRALGDPSARHTAARIGHASSTDLRNWTVHDEALGPSATGWDDLSLWTGSVTRGDDGLWRLFYTALNTGGHGVKDQRIGVAESPDLHTWSRVGSSPLVDPDPRWYRTLGVAGVASETWRDPFVVRDPEGDGWHMFITARATGGRRHDDGVLAHATSADLRSWTLAAPVCAPGAGFGQLEVPQIRYVEGRWLLIFTCHPKEQTAARRAEFGDFCTWTAGADNLLGPWDLTRAEPFRAMPDLFAAPLVHTPSGGWVLLGFRDHDDDDGESLFVLDPTPVRRVGDALLTAG